MCIGCLRTLKEIGAWRNMSLAEKKATVEACAARAKLIPPRGADGRALPPRAPQASPWGEAAERGPSAVENAGFQPFFPQGLYSRAPWVQLVVGQGN